MCRWASASGRINRGDPLVAQQYAQVWDVAPTLLAVICQQHLAHQQHEDDVLHCNYLKQSVAALRKLGIKDVEVYDCTALHQQQHHRGRNVTAGVGWTPCEGVEYHKSVTDARTRGENADVFLMLGNSFVPTLTDQPLHHHAHNHHQHHHQQQQHNHNQASDQQQKTKTRIYFHTGASHHMNVLISEKKPLSVRETNVAIRNIGMYDQIIFARPKDKESYALLMNPLFSSASSPQHSGHPTMVSVPPRLATLLEGGEATAPTTQQYLETQLVKIIIDGILGAPFLSFVRSRLNFLRSSVLLDHARHRDTSGGSGASGGTGWFGSGKPSEVVDKLVAMIIEPRLEASFEFCVRNVMSHLGDAWMLHVHHSKANEKYVKQVLHDVVASRVKYVALPEPFSDSGHYNQYLKSASFWSALSMQGVEHVLIFQSDTLMLESPHKIGDFLKFSFVGAPWHMTPGAESADWLRAMNKKKQLTRGVGNGGFSLRNVSAMLRIAEHHRSKNPAINEDVFFLLYLDSATLPSRQEAYQFAREMPCHDLDPSTHPLAVHNAWVYSNKTEAQNLFAQAFIPL